MKIPEYFNLLVTVCGQKGGVGGEELVGMEELELSLQDYESPLNIRDCEFPKCNSNRSCNGSQGGCEDP